MWYMFVVTDRGTDLASAQKSLFLLLPNERVTHIVYIV